MQNLWPPHRLILTDTGSNAKAMLKPVGNLPVEPTGELRSWAYLRRREENSTIPWNSPTSLTTGDFPMNPDFGGEVVWCHYNLAIIKYKTWFLRHCEMRFKCFEKQFFYCRSLFPNYLHSLSPLGRPQRKNLVAWTLQQHLMCCQMRIAISFVPPCVSKHQRSGRS